MPLRYGVLLARQAVTECKSVPGREMRFSIGRNLLSNLSAASDLLQFARKRALTSVAFTGFEPEYTGADFLSFSHASNNIKPAVMPGQSAVIHAGYGQ